MKLTKSYLKKLKTVNVIRELMPISNTDFIEKCKKDVIRLYGETALSELKIENREVIFRQNRVKLVDDNKPIETLEGNVTFHSTNYNFKSGLTSSWADITSMTMTDTGWVLPCFNGNKYIYTLKELYDESK